MEALLARVPETIQQAIEPDWLTFALEPVTGGARVLSVEPVETIHTVASKVRIAVTIEGEEAKRHFCLKAFIGAEYHMGGETTYREARFYKDLAPQITMRVPPVPVVVSDEGGQAILIMEDLIAAGARFCSALEPFTPDQAAQSLEQLARLHVATHLVEQTPWLPRRVTFIHEHSHLTPEQTQALLDDPRGIPLAERTRSAATLFKSLKALDERLKTREAPISVCHGDCHAGNIYWTKDGPGFTDWQLIQHGHWSLDVAYHIAAILPVEVAEAEERRLLNHYLDFKHSLGGPAPDHEAAFEDFRAAQVYGFYHWAITRFQPTPVTYEFTKRLGAGIERHDTYDLLGV